MFAAGCKKSNWSCEIAYVLFIGLCLHLIILSLSGEFKSLTYNNVVDSTFFKSTIPKHTETNQFIKCWVELKIPSIDLSMIINIVVRAWRQLPRPITSPIGRAIGQDWFWLTPCSGLERADWSVRESRCCVMWEHVQPSWSTTDCWTNGEWDEELLEPRKSSRPLSLWACWNTIAKRTGIPGAGLRASCESRERTV